MNDRRAHFLIMVGDSCLAAGIGELRVEIALRDGTRASGVPSPQVAARPLEEIDGTGYSKKLLLNGMSVELDEVVEFTVFSC